MIGEGEDDDQDVFPLVFRTLADFQGGV